MIDFGSLPPEVNSSRMYAGAGAMPLQSAAQAWSTVAAEIESSVAEIHATVSSLGAAWQGPSSDAMAQKMGLYASWLMNTAAVAQHTAAQAQAAVAAYEAAFAATVNPAEISLNRSTFATLVATNILGQNTAAIMENEAEYAEMWAQDAAAMNAYNAQSTAATQLQSFPQPAKGTQNSTPTTSTATSSTTFGTIFQSLFGETPLAWVDETFQSLLSSAPYNVPISLLSMFNVLWAVSSAGSNPISDAINKIHNDIQPVIEPPAAVITKPTGGSADFRIGAGERIGGISVPPSWAGQLAKGEEALDSAMARFVPFAAQEGSPLGVMPFGGTGTAGASSDRIQQPKYRGHKVQVLPEGGRL